VTEKQKDLLVDNPTGQDDVFAGLLESDLQVGRLNTLSDPESGDTIIAETGNDQFTEDALKQQSERWQKYLGSIEGEADNAESESKYRVARKKMAEIALLNAMIGQVKTDIDSSDEIDRHESELYGHYDDDLYKAALAQKIRQIEQLPIGGDPNLETARADLLDTLDKLVGNDRGNIAEIAEPTSETLQQIGQWLSDEHVNTIMLIDSFENDTLSADSIKQVFEDAIARNDALRELGWRVEIVDREKQAISVYASERKIVVPSKRQATKAALKKTSIHEYYHALRSANAEMSGNIVGRFGTADYPSFEESFMIALEQCLEGKYDPKRGIDHYVTIGLSATSKLPREEIARITQSMKQLEKSDNGISDDAVEAAKRLTGVQIKRTFAGMTDVDDGIAHKKDIDYYHGINNAWKLLNELTEKGIVKEGLAWVMAAKFNPFIKQERELIEKYHPMPKELQDFFSD